ncbi:MAG: bifunctional 3,4-dihydroxy-2-butanone-4-phosphate synthase/GTP cyclohydrolase II [Chloroflexi bacterium]|jgi:3,4-dihydroxy 2-butanone 4-phosphate synthase/GTP cyclohydrolase II|nr:bifunctional 3,4-dihydroxy-2-butanone-4-phosphate synthase/GTP cyclohydrolase II [Dehalococcoidia bacterium]PKB81051.1 MAG: bifunctional 3,4-dihydroxy-2-butanone 4-phosphate synthase/GTP cyclohydrolase II [SAR202 cluster bacterium MP-SInd-SRR3963457-G1]RUA19985.1 MAG: bifunctional 3,4-dihydroxy-2-butanone-4-phosphate synthase/GTP cyclohydrolase II [Chloroflexota bacterium]RUA31945.1 MAG: bifunctional 3,4-dihydroxy-2-butanone-4-phosphate synthase/GTP cyclohydrolase II [Chloroflexota bacterium]
MPLCSLEEGLEELKAGRFLIVVDDENRENEGDLVMPAEMVTAEAVNFVVTHARGLLCMPIIGERLDELQIPLMVSQNGSEKNQTAFTVSVDYNVNTTTGISAGDRAATILAMLDPKTKPEELTRPGHLFPLRYHPGGVLARAGHTEAAVDLCEMLGMYPAGIVCEIMAEDGSMSRLPQLEEFAEEHGLKILSIAQIIAQRRRTERLIERVAEARLPTRYGPFQAIAYKSHIDSGEHIALTIGEWTEDEPVLVRIHSECLTGDVFGSMRCDCGEQIDLALKQLAEAGNGIFLYMRQEGRGIGLHNKIKAYSLQDQGLDTVEANETLGFEPDLRHYGVGAQILRDLGVRKLNLLTNNPKKVAGLSGFDLEIVDRIPVEAEVTDENRTYLKTKKARMGHILGNC